MHYFCHRSKPKVTYKPGEEHAKAIIHIEFEMSAAGQCDGHEPTDWNLDFAAAILGNLEREPLAEILKENNIQGFSHVWWQRPECYSVKITDLKSLKEFSPNFLVEIIVSLVANDDIYLNCANQLMNAIPVDMFKQEILKHEQLRFPEKI